MARQSICPLSVSLSCCIKRKYFHIKYLTVSDFYWASFDWRRGGLQSYLEFKWFKFSTFLLRPALCPQGNYFQDTTWRRQRSLKHNFSVVCIVFLLLLSSGFHHVASFKVEQKKTSPLALERPWVEADFIFIAVVVVSSPTWNPVPSPSEVGAE